MSERNRLINDNSASAEYDLQTYSKRWILSLLIGIQLATNRFTVSSFGIINDVTVNYFDISYAAVDWFVMIRYPGTMVGSFFMIFQSILEIIGFKQLSMIVNFFSLLAYLLMMIAVAFNSTYPLIYISQFLLAVTIVVLALMNTEVAKSWYPDKEVGKALSVYAVSLALGAMLGSVIPSHVITFNNQTISKNMTMLHFHNSTMKEIWKEKIKIELYKLYGPLLLVTIIIFLLFLLTFEDRPPKPPSLAQAQIRNIEELNEAACPNNKIDFKFYLQEYKEIIFNKTMLMISFAYGFNITVSILFLTYLGEVLREVFEKLSISVEPDILSGYVLLSVECSKFVGSFVSGMGLDQFQKLKLQVVLAVSIASISSLCLAVTYICRILIGIFIFSIIIGFVYGYLDVFSFEIVYRNLHPIKPEKIFPTKAIISSLVATLLSIFYRIILNYSSGVWVVAFQSALFAISTLFYSLVKVKSVA